MKHTLCAVLACAAVSSSANAALIAYQSFGGTPGGLSGTNPNQGSSSGFTGNWAAISNGNLAYVTNSLAILNDSSGADNRAQKAQAGGASGNDVNVQTNLASTVSTTSGALYVSFKFNANWTAGTGQVSLHLLTGSTASTANSGTTTYTIGTNAANTAFRLAGTTQSTSTNTTDSVAYANGTTYLFIGKIDMATGADTMSFNIYRDFNNLPTLEPGTFTMNYTTSVTNDADITGLRLATNNDANEDVTVAFDEIRLGTDWASVNPIPEPRAALLGGLGLLALLRRRRN